MKYTDLLEGKATESEMREFLAAGEMTPITFRIPRNLKESAQEVARNKGMSFSAFVRMCMMQELVKRG